jgi:dimethylamine/trimethylamine dehydrogenase
MTNEQPQVHRELANAGITLHTLALVKDFAAGELVIADLFSGAEQRLPCRSLVVVGARLGHGELYGALLARRSDWTDAGIEAVDLIGDALAPGAIAHAVYSGHRYAREFDRDPQAPLYKRDAPIVASEPRIYEESSDAGYGDRFDGQ